MPFASFIVQIQCVISDPRSTPTNINHSYWIHSLPKESYDSNRFIPMKSLAGPLPTASCIPSREYCRIPPKPEIEPPERVCCRVQAPSAVLLQRNTWPDFGLNISKRSIAIRENQCHIIKVLPTINWVLRINNSYGCCLSPGEQATDAPKYVLGASPLDIYCSDQAVPFEVQIYT